MGVYGILNLFLKTQIKSRKTIKEWLLTSPEGKKRKPSTFLQEI
jgi:hypothetical protein